MRRDTWRFNVNSKNYHLILGVYVAGFGHDEVQLFVNTGQLKNTEDKRKLPMVIITTTNSFWHRGDRYGAQRAKSVSAGGKSVLIFI